MTIYAFVCRHFNEFINLIMKTNKIKSSDRLNEDIPKLNKMINATDLDYRRAEFKTKNNQNSRSFHQGASISGQIKVPVYRTSFHNRLGLSESTANKEKKHSSPNFDEFTNQMQLHLKENKHHASNPDVSKSFKKQHQSRSSVLLSQSKKIVKKESALDQLLINNKDNFKSREPERQSDQMIETLFNNNKEKSLKKTKTQVNSSTHLNNVVPGNVETKGSERKSSKRSTRKKLKTLNSDSGKAAAKKSKGFFSIFQCFNCK